MTRTVAVLALVLLAIPAGAETKEVSHAIGEDEALYRCKSRTAEVAVNFKPDMELKELMTWVVGFTCKNFIVDPRVGALVGGKKITVIAPTKMTATEAYRLFLVALSTMNLTVVPKGNVLRVTDAGAARSDTVPIYDKGKPDAGDQVVRYILRPTYAAPEVLAQALGTMKSSIGDVQQIGTMLMMTDYASNVRDMLALTKLVDVPKGSEGIFAIGVTHANATNVVEKVNGLLGVAAASAAPPAKPVTGQAGVAPSKVMVDERTNTILLVASELAFQRYQAIVKTIDLPLDIEGGSSVHVYRLKYALAEDLAKTLNDTVGQQTAPASKEPPKPPPPGDGIGTAIDGKVRVIADKPTNSLIVMSTGRDYLALKDIIAQLDIERPQVYIETMIVEVTIGNGTVTDGAVHGASPLDKATLLGGVHTTSFNSIFPGGGEGSTSTPPVLASGLVAGLLGSSVQFLGLTIPSYGVLFNAISNKSRTKILQTPSMMAVDNGVAKFKVGKTILMEGATVANPLGGATTSRDPRDLNLELELKPHITSDNSILLEIRHDSKELPVKGTLGTEWSNRNYETSVIVRDQQTVVIGGIMQERVDHSTSGVPLLADLPLLGRLFSYQNKNRVKSNMLILLTPYIVRSHLDLEQIRNRKVREHEEFVGSLQAFEGMKYQPKTDYGRKRGLVEEINRAVLGVEQDARDMQTLRRPAGVPTGPIEVPTPEP